MNDTVLIGGASGLVGQALVRALERAGKKVRELVRNPRSADGVRKFAWDPQAQTLDPLALAGVGAVINLAGENIGKKRWSAEQKANIVASRVKGTELLARALAGLPGTQPVIWINASAVGLYGETGDRSVDESAPPGAGFLADVCRQWEGATAAAPAHTRVVLARLGIVLAKDDGALAQMLPLFKAGLGGRLGPGSQYMSWIHLDDVVRAMLHVLDRADLCGPVNFVSPEPVTNAQFTSTLGRVLSRPALVPAPSFALRLALGREQADQLLLTSTRVRPRALLNSGFSFSYPDLESALSNLLQTAC